MHKYVKKSILEFSSYMINHKKTDDWQNHGAVYFPQNSVFA